MASQISHIVYGKKIFDRIDNSSLDWQKFLVATVFPDIRQLAGIDRDLSHVYNTSEENIPLTDSFEAGFYVHSYVDERRFGILDEFGLYEGQDDIHSFDSALKLREDFLFYDEYADWDGVVSTLDTVYEQEVVIVKNISVVQKWHKFLQIYFAQKPNVEIWIKLMKIAHIDEKVQASILNNYKNIERDINIDTMLKKMKEEI